jgi:ribosomal protein S3
MLYIEEFFYKISTDSLVDNTFRAIHLKIQVSGKIGKNMRSVKRIFNFNDVVARDIPAQTLNKSIDFSLTEVISRAGILGFKI